MARSPAINERADDAAAAIGLASGSMLQLVALTRHRRPTDASDAETAASSTTTTTWRPGAAELTVKRDERRRTLWTTPQRLCRVPTTLADILW